MNAKTVIIGIGVLSIVTGIAIFLLPPQAHAPTTETPTPQPTGKEDLVVATSPQPHTQVSSPLVVTGKARGTWYFEASFPIEVQNSSGNVIGQGYAQAKGEWMTTDFVPFESIPITFTAQPVGSIGKVILRKDNPSGLPEHEDALEIPVQF